MFGYCHFSVDAVSTVLVEDVDVIEDFFVAEQQEPPVFVIDVFLADVPQWSSLMAAAAVDAFFAGASVDVIDAFWAVDVVLQHELPFLDAVFSWSPQFGDADVTANDMLRATAAAAIMRTFIAHSCLGCSVVTWFIANGAKNSPFTRLFQGESEAKSVPVHTEKAPHILFGLRGLH